MKIRRRFPKAEVPTSSMADIAFLLIIFFMLTAVFTSSRGLLYEFPKDDPTDLNVQPEEAIHIKIVGEGQFAVDRTPMSYQQMEAYIQDRLERNPGKPVIVETQPEIPYFVMIDVFDMLKKLNVKNVSIPTKTERERWRNFFR